MGSYCQSPRILPTGCFTPAAALSYPEAELHPVQWRQFLPTYLSLYTLWKPLKRSLLSSPSPPGPQFPSGDLRRITLLSTTSHDCPPPTAWRWAWGWVYKLCLAEATTLGFSSHARPHPPLACWCRGSVLHQLFPLSTLGCIAPSLEHFPRGASSFGGLCEHHATSQDCLSPFLKRH